MSQIESVQYPKVHQRPDGRVEVVVNYKGKRMRLQNGNTFGIQIKPNSFPESQRVNQGMILAAEIYAKLASGYNPLANKVVNKIHLLSDVDILERALQHKIKQELSSHYEVQLSYSFNSLIKNTIGGIVTKRSVEQTLSHFHNSTSYNTMRRGLIVLFNTARELGWDKNPMEGIGNRRAKASLNKPLGYISALLEEIKVYNDNLYLCCLLTYGCLLRPHREVRELKWSDFSDDLSHIRLAGNRNKSGRNRIVPVPSYIKENLKRKNGHLNIFTGAEQAFHPDYFKGLWSRFKKRTELLEANQTLYSFRHTGAIEIYKRTGSIEKLKAAMGHSNVMVSLTYLRGLDVAELMEEDMPKI
jgi:integrase